MLPQSQNVRGSITARADASADFKQRLELASVAIPSDNISLLNVGTVLARSKVARDETSSAFAHRQYRYAGLARRDDRVCYDYRSIDTPACPGIGRFAQQFVIRAVPALIDEALRR